MRIPQAIRIRLTLWYVLVLAIILTTFSGGVYVALRESLYSTLDSNLESRAAALAGIVEIRNGAPSLPAQAAVPDRDREQFVRLFGLDGRLIVDTSPGGAAPVDPEALAAARRGRTRLRTTMVAGEPFRVLAGPVRRGGTIHGVIEVGQASEDVTDTLGNLLMIVLLAIPATLALASLGGVFLARRALAPIDQLTRVAQQITGEDLSRRIEQSLPDDEVGRLGRTFNAMIACLDEAFRRQRQFTADASHELRTPLTAIKGQLDVALARPRSPEAYREVLEAVNQDVDRLIRLVGSLLTLARADGGQIPIHHEAVDLPLLVTGGVDQVAPVADHAGVRFTVLPGPEVTVWADEDLLLQLILNLLDNAVKYTPSGGRVTVGWEVVDGQVRLWVRDSGIGSPPSICRSSSTASIASTRRAAVQAVAPGSDWRSAGGSWRRMAARSTSRVSPPVARRSMSGSRSTGTPSRAPSAPNPLTRLLGIRVPAPAIPG
ncbi:MAG: histidine kinase dimerization/phospho-acceptor domain-containing protein [Sphaerobacter sp.]|nr:histidine kinase dimerization/phospho-acceptor domain-containing protein [Sphaerobacter sp.]